MKVSHSQCSHVSISLLKLIVKMNYVFFFFNLTGLVILFSYQVCLFFYSSGGWSLFFPLQDIKWFLCRQPCKQTIHQNLYKLYFTRKGLMVIWMSTFHFIFKFQANTPIVYDFDFVMEGVVLVEVCLVSISPFVDVTLKLIYQGCIRKYKSSQYIDTLLSKMSL